MVPPSSGWPGATSGMRTGAGTCCRRSTWRCGAAFAGSTAAARFGRGCIGSRTTLPSHAQFVRTPRCRRLVGLDAVAETLQDGRDEERVIDRKRALDRIYEKIHRLRPIDRQIMLLHLEQIGAAEIAEITGLSAPNVATRVHRIKQLLIRQFHGGATHVT
jgi:hypothetical protein